MAMGHTVQQGGVNVTYRNMAWRIDEWLSWRVLGYVCVIFRVQGSGLGEREPDGDGAHYSARGDQRRVKA